LEQLGITRVEPLAIQSDVLTDQPSVPALEKPGVALV